MRLLKLAERHNFIKFQLPFQPRNFATTPTLAEDLLDFFAQLSRRGARELSRATSFCFVRISCRARLPKRQLNFKRKFKRAERERFRKAQLKNPRMSVKEIFRRFPNKKRRTIELTWGETDYTQRSG